MSIPDVFLKILEVAVEKIALPAAQAALVETAENIADHPDPVRAAQLAALVTSSRAGTLEIANAAFWLRKKSKK